MAKLFQSGKWKRRTVCALSCALAATFALGLATACKEPAKEEVEDKPETTQSDPQLIKNGNFEYYSDATLEKDKRLNFINTPNNWSNSVYSENSSSAPSSDTKSGIVNVNDWADMTASTHSLILGEDVSDADAIANAIAHWSEASLYDRLEFLDHYRTAVSALADGTDEAAFFADYQYTIDFEDVEKLREEVGEKLVTRRSDDDESLASNTGVLMIHNQRRSNDVTGSAQKFTSSSTVTLKAGTAAEFSVWVKTAALKHWDDQEVESIGGAYIGVTHTVGGTSLTEMQVRNINTEKSEAAKTNGWEKYTFYVRASSFANSTFTVVLGLGNGTSDNMDLCVNGYAFFDDLTCSVISADDYITKTQSLSVDYQCNVASEKEDKRFLVQNPMGSHLTGREFALDLQADALLDDLNAAPKFSLTEEVSGSQTYTSERLGYGDDANNYKAFDSLSAHKAAAESNAVLKRLLSDNFDGEAYPLNQDKNVLLIASLNGASYTASMTSNVFSLEPSENLMLSFFVKTSKIPSGMYGAGAKIIETVSGEETAISPFDSNTVDTIDIDETNTDITNGWVQCFFFITNSSEETLSFRLELTYGTTQLATATKHSFADGFAAFTGLQTRKLSKTKYSYASTGSQAVKVTLKGDAVAENRFDAVSATDKNTVKTSFGAPANYTGVLAGGKFITGNSDDGVAKPDNVYTGVLKSEYADAYAQNSDNNAWKDILGASSAGWWSGVMGDAVQPLAIVTGAGDPAAYGYIGKSTTVSTSAYQRISMRVKVSPNAKAYVYLTDASDVRDGYQNRLTPVMPLVTYWYDDDGNICASDPTDKDFEDTGILYKLQPNGLYRKTGDNSGDYYANLHNYDKDDDGNLITDDKTVAYYLHDGAYYAYYDESRDTYSTVVKNLPTDIARYDFTSTTMPEACIVVEGKETPVWVDVNFFVHTGSQSKQYRLEVFSGSRDGSVKNPANSYVIFDNYSSTSVSSDYEGILSSAVDKLKEDEANVDADGKLKDALYYTFTFYDSTSYLRYDETTDEENAGNSYSNYKQSTYSEQLVYLDFIDAEGSMTGIPIHSLFIDYAQTNVTVTPSNDNSADEEEPADTADSGDMNWLLLFASLALAVVLLFVVGAIIFRKLPKKSKSQKAKKNKKSKQSEKQRKDNNVKADAKDVKTVDKSADVRENDDMSDMANDEDNPYNE